MLAAYFWQQLFGMPQIAVIMGCLIPIVSVIAGSWRRVQKARSENELKRKLVEQGLSVDEIERIIAAQPKEPWDPRH